MSAYVSIRQHTSAHLSLRQQYLDGQGTADVGSSTLTSAYVSICQPTPASSTLTSAYVSICQPTYCHTTAPSRYCYIHLWSADSFRSSGVQYLDGHTNAGRAEGVSIPFSCRPNLARVAVQQLQVKKIIKKKNAGRAEGACTPFRGSRKTSHALQFSSCKYNKKLK